MPVAIDLGHPRLHRVGVSLLIGVLGGPDWRVGVVALAGSVLGGRISLAARAAVAVVTGSAVAHFVPGLAPMVIVALVALAPIERLAGGSALVLGLALVAGQGAWGVARAELASRSLTPDSSAALLSEAISLARAAGLRNLEGSERATLVMQEARAGRHERALAILSEAPAPRLPEVELALAEQEVDTGHVPEARFRLTRLAKASPSARAELGPRTATLWARALLRRGMRREAGAALEGVEGPEAAELRRMATSEVEPNPASSFAGVIRLVESPLPTGCLARGTTAHFTWTWEVQTGFAPAENDVAFVHAYSPLMMGGADHLIGGRLPDTLRPGERVVDRFDLPVETWAAPGKYTLNVGVYEPTTGMRLQPLDRPEHQSYEAPGTIEVCP